VKQWTRPDIAGPGAAVIASAEAIRWPLRALAPDCRIASMKRQIHEARETKPM